MDKTKIEVFKFQMEYPRLNLKLKKENLKEYERAIIALHYAEADRGFKIEKINKPTKKGTKVTFTPIESKEDLDSYIQKIKELMSDYTRKWHEAVF